MKKSETKKPEMEKYVAVATIGAAVIGSAISGSLNAAQEQADRFVEATPAKERQASRTLVVDRTIEAMRSARPLA